ncbi:MAG TPA: hypothetical protein VK894_10060 [Jiangellales bacterium]|nr:hypothetical protein [Jiangellales bacterium]
MEAWGRTLQRRQGVAVALLILAVTVAMVGGVTGSWPVIVLGLVGLLVVLVPMAAVRSRR